MSNPKKKPITATGNQNVHQKEPHPFKMPYPFLWLSLVVLMVYSNSLNNGYTELDDSIFINEMHSFNEQPSNLIHSFQRGVFSETEDTYYRPMLLNSFIINNLIAGSDIKYYHAFNILFHLIAVLLLFMLFQRLKVSRLHSFLLALLFAVHPALSQAVSWIPGRNDTLLAIFSFSFMIFALEYIRQRKLYFLILQLLCLLPAFFTKETTLLLPVAFFILLISTQETEWKNKNNVILYVTWLLCGVIWFISRTNATLKPSVYHDAVTGFFQRSPIAIQYLGKALLPCNLSVFPMMHDTSYIFGIIAIFVLALLIYFSKQKDRKIITGGFAWFILLLFPVFILPASINEQDFEHRLYLPLIGFLLVLSQTALFKNFSPPRTAMMVLSICLVFAGINYNHQSKFSDPQTFWAAAVETTPNSAYATMMLAARTDSTDLPKARSLMRRAYTLNPKEKYVNYYLGKQFLEEGKVDSAKKYLLDELSNSKYYDTYFLLSRVAFLQKNSAESIQYMEQYLEKDPANSQAINNYVLMLVESGQKTKALDFLNKKRAANIPVRQELFDLTK